MHIIPHNKPSLGDEEIKAVESVIKSNWIIAGKEVEKFEETLKNYTGNKYAVALNSGHAALHLSLLTLGIKENDEVIIPSYVTPDLLNVIYYCRAVPVIVDTADNSFNIDPQKAIEKCTKRTKAMIIPHIFGFPADIEQLKQCNIPIIEDCAQSLGTVYKGKPLGLYGDLTVFSFYASKIITTGQGGMALTNNHDYSENMRDLIRYNMPPAYRVRYNYPMTDIAAAIGNVQYAKLETFLEKRKNIGNKYRKILKNKKINYYPGDDELNINHFRFLIQFKDNKQLIFVKEELAKKGITAIIPCPPNETGHRILNLNIDEFKNTETLVNTVLSIPIFPNLTEEEIEKITTTLENIL